MGRKWVIVMYLKRGKCSGCEGRLHRETCLVVAADNKSAESRTQEKADFSRAEALLRHEGKFALHSEDP
jgi:hypothetical protein